MVILLMSLEVLRELQDALAENCHLNFRRTCVGLVNPVLRYNLRLLFVRQCHSRKDTPRLNLYLLLFYIRIAQIIRALGSVDAPGARGHKLEEMAVRVTKIQTLTAALPCFAPHRHTPAVEPCLPSRVFGRAHGKSDMKFTLAIVRKLEINRSTLLK